MQICKYFCPIPNLFKEIYLRESRAFLMRIFVVFLLLTDPASRKANPACITATNKYKHTVIILKIETVKIITLIVLNCMGWRVGTDFCIKNQQGTDSYEKSSATPLIDLVCSYEKIFSVCNPRMHSVYENPQLPSCTCGKIKFSRPSLSQLPTHSHT